MTGKEARQRLGILVQEIENKKTELDNVLNSVNQIKLQIDTINNDVNTKLTGINSVESEINQKRTSINEVLNEVTKNKNEANVAKEATEQSSEKVEEFRKHIEDLVTKATNIQQRSQELENQIENELKSGTTSVNLSKSFADKVLEYRQNARFWSKLFVIFVIIFVGYYGFITFNVDQVHDLQEVWLDLLFRLPFFVFVVWLAIFFGNRRAESKKLEESYKHKEVMARSFVGYKKILEELGDNDQALLKQHMQNLLTAIGKDSGDFIDSEGDKHPVFGILASWFGKSDKA